MVKNIRKILCLIVMAALVCSSVSFAYAEDSAEPNIKEAEILSALGISSLKSNSQDAVTQGVFTDMLLAISSLGKGITDEKIEALTDMKILPFDNTLRFKAEDVLTLEKAAAAAVKFTGHGRIAEAKGGYPNGYIMTARNIGITDGIKGAMNESLTAYDAVTLIFNTMNTDIMTVKEVDRNGECTYETIAGKTHLSEYLGVYCETGLFEANSDMAIIGNICAEGTARIGGKLYTIAQTGRYIGKTVEVYYKLDKNSNVRTVLYISETRSNSSLTVNAEDINNYRNLAYTYKTEKGTNKTVKIPQDIKIIYNSVVAGSDSIDDVKMKPESGEITLIDCNGDRKYDYLIIRSCETYTVQSTDIKNEVIYAKSKTLGTKKFRMKAYETFGIYNASSVKQDVSAVKANNIISVFESADRKRVEIYNSTAVVSGIVSEISSKNGTNLIIGETTYKTASFLEADIASEKLKAGDEVTVYLDVYGKIADYHCADTTYRWGYLIDTKRTQKGFDKNFKFQIYDINDKAVKEITASEKLTIDDVSGIKSESLEAYFIDSDGYTKDGILKYKTNADGELTHIDLPEDTYSDIITGGGSGLQRMFASGYNTDGTRIPFYFRHDSYVFVGTGGFAVNQNTVFLDVPSRRGDLELYDVKSVTKIGKEGNRYADAYRTGNDSLIPEVVVNYLGNKGLPDRTESSGNTYSNNTADINLKDYVSLVTDITRAYDEISEETLERITFNQKGVEKSYYVYKEGFANYLGLKKGDIVLYALNDKNRVCAVNIYANAFDVYTAGGNGQTHTLAEFGGICGTIYYKKDTVITVTSKAVSETLPSDLMVFDTKSPLLGKAYLYNLTDESMSVVTAADIIDYMSCYDETVSTKAFIQTWVGTPYSAILFTK